VAAVYAIVGAAYNPPAVTALLLLVAATLMVAFAAVERRTKAPLVPLGIFASSRNLTVSNVVMALAVVGMVGWFFSALYLQRVLGYDSLATSLAYLPATVALGAISQGPAARAVNRLGIKPTILGGMGLMAAGLLFFAREPVGGSFLLDVLPGMLVLGVGGAAFAFMAVILAATAGVPEAEAGLASGLVNTSQQMGGALGLAALAVVAAAYTASLEGFQPASLNSGYHAAFLLGAGCVVLGALIAATLLRPPIDRDADPE
jgi:hypothetical protein